MLNKSNIKCGTILVPSAINTVYHKNEIYLLVFKCITCGDIEYVRQFDCLIVKIIQQFIIKKQG